jgi:hypothetical protein
VSHRIAFAFSFTLAMLTALCPSPATAQRSCENLASLTLRNATIISATPLAAGTFQPSSSPGQSAPAGGMPAFCRVAGVAKPTSDSEIKFEVWLPVSGWNGKFEQVGNGGFAGAIPQAAMAMPWRAQMTATPWSPVARGRERLGRSATPRK